MQSDSYFENNCSNDPAGSSSKHDDLTNNDRHLVNVGSKTDQEIGYSVEPLSGDVPQEAADFSCNENNFGGLFWIFHQEGYRVKFFNFS